MNKKPLLPQNDPDREDREKKLAETRTQLFWCQDYLKPLALLYLEGGSKLGTLQRFEWAAEGIFEPLHDLGPAYVARRAKSEDKVVANNALTRKDGKVEAFTSFDQYAQLFKALPRPGFVDTWSLDSEFAYQRLGGVDPLVIRRIDAVPAHFAITDERLGGLLRPGETLDPRPSAVYTPRDGKAWVMAKICAQCADASYHEMGPHLLGTHFMEETFCISFVRQLASNHPVYKLVFPHFYELMLNNVLGRQSLIDKGGAVDELMGGTVESSLRILQRAYEGYPSRGIPPWSFEDWDLPLSLDARGVSGIPDYPYRDDGLLVWGAIERFVAAYVGVYYPSDAEVAADTELQAWMRDLTDPEGGHVRGVPGAVLGVAPLVTFLTRLIFACGPLHSAINFSQYDAMAFIPNMPLALYATVPDDACSLDDEALTSLVMRLLPPPDKAALQLETIDALTSLHFGKLGQYEDGYFSDPPAALAVLGFQQDLASVEAEIERRNRDRPLRGLRAYRYLLPSLITPSTSM